MGTASVTHLVAIKTVLASTRWAFSQQDGGPGQDPGGRDRFLAARLGPKNLFLA